MNYYLCQDCLHVIKSDLETDWEKYHNTDESCPICGGDMCGCDGCQDHAIKIIGKTALSN